MSTPPPVLVMADVARLLGLPTAEAARKFIARHGIPHSRLGKRTFILLASLIDYIKSHETVASPEAVKSGSHRLATSARAISRHSRVDLRTAAVRLATRVAETPNISK